MEEKVLRIEGRTSFTRCAASNRIMQSATGLTLEEFTAGPASNSQASTHASLQWQKECGRQIGPSKR